MYELYDRILGSLTASGMGDGIGAPSEAMSRAEILERFGGPIGGFEPPTGNFYCEGNETAEITDDTSQLWEMGWAMVETRGRLTEKAAADALLRWSREWPRHYPRNAGPTMRHWVEEYAAGGDPVELGKTGLVYGRGISNGCAMRVSPAALCYPGDLDGAIDTAVTMTRVSHGTQHALSGACAVAAAIAEALTERATVSSVLKAGVYGAKKGEQIGLRVARQAYGPRVLPKLIKGIELAYAADSPEDASRRIEDEIGCNGDIQPTVGVVFGLFAANDGDVRKCLLAAANIGGDTDTFGCILGMIAGAYQGFHAIPADWCETFRRGNPTLDFQRLAKELTAVAEERSGR